VALFHSNNIIHFSSNLLRRVVLPVTQNKPTGTAKFFIRIPISCLILLDFVFPPIIIMSGNVPMFRTPVPETTVNEDGHFFSGKCNVDGAPGCSRNRILHPISQALFEKQPPYCHFRAGGPFRHAAHGPRNCFRYGRRTSLHPAFTVPGRRSEFRIVCKHCLSDGARVRIMFTGTALPICRAICPELP
jgi:hypothetical protein